MTEISWCLKQKKGIELVEPNDNLCEAYFLEAEQTLQEIDNKESKWAVIMGYYASYHALYAILMKAGVKCEIHDCTIKLMGLIDSFTSGDFNFLTNLKDKRIKAQYYLKKDGLDNLDEVKLFVLKCRKIADELDINTFRGRLNEKK